MQERTDFTASAVILFADNTSINLTSADFTMQNNSVTDGAGASALPLGEAICRTIQIELMNDDDRFSDYDFYGAQITLTLNFPVTDSTTESLLMGYFTVLTPATYGETVIISASDDMWKADKPYESDLVYPTTLKDVFVEACTKCSLSYDQNITFLNEDLNISSPLSNEYTFRQVFGFIAMLAGGNARISYSRYLELIPYSFDYTNYQNDLTNWANGLELGVNDLTITGLSTVAHVTTETEGEDGEIITEETDETVLIGTDDYVLALENPFFAGQETPCLTSIGTLILNKSFRRFTGSYIANPLPEFMDTAKITDRKGNVYYSIITDIEFKFGGFSTFSCNVEDVIQNNSSFSSPAQAVAIEAKRLIAQERNARELAYDRLNEALANSSGLYRTDEQQPDGSTIYYLHDRPTIAESNSVIKVTADAIGLSTDGGQTYPYGVQINGDVIANILNANGINADWIRTGTISSADGRTQIRLDDGTFSLAGDALSYDSDTLSIDASTLNVDGNSVATESQVEENTTNLQNQIDGISDIVQEQAGFIQIDATVPQMILGKDGSDAAITITNSQVHITGSDNAEAILEGSQLTAPQAQFDNIYLGNYMWINRTGGHVSLKYIGE